MKCPICSGKLWFERLEMLPVLPTGRLDTVNGTYGDDSRLFCEQCGREFLYAFDVTGTRLSLDADDVAGQRDLLDSEL
jgi:hypothetical protein